MHPYRKDFQSGRSTCWQNAFIHDNFPVLGYYAWEGFERFGWGLVACHVEPPPGGSQPSFYRWNFTTQFVPEPLLAAYLQDAEVAPDEIPALITAIAQYNPHQEIMLLIRFGKTIEVNWLRNRTMSPPECYWQVRDRWEEFMPDTLI